MKTEMARYTLPREPLLCRSMLMTCGLHERRFKKACEVGADISTLDLEDSVPAPRKDEARRLVLPFFNQPATGRSLRTIRINCLRSTEGLRDLLAILDSGARPDALFVPKVESAEDILILQEILGERLASTIFLVLIETAAGLCAVEAIAKASPRVRALVFGGADYSAEIGTGMSWEPMAYARSRIVVAASHAGIPAMDSPFFDIEDEEGLRAEIQRTRELGFQGKVAVHTRQIGAINEGYTPRRDAVERARRVVASIDQNNGQISVLDGSMIGPPMLLAARRLLALADKIEAYAD
jgi:citrate lyase beta subunit